MALDNAQFIAELSVIDPPGTDPVNQGDDHIRTTKLAVQQSFPNVGSAVPQTGVQMAQMAIKNEANTFTAINIFSQQQQGGNGSAAAPLWSFQNSPNMGLFRNASAQLGVAFGGIEVATFASTNFDITLNLRGPGGSAVLPSHTFSGASGNGMFNVSATVLGFSTAGIERLRISDTQMRVRSPTIRAAAAGPTAPTYSWEADPTIGMYRDTAGRISFAAASTLHFLIQNSLVQSQVHFQGQSTADFIGLLTAQAQTAPATRQTVITRESSFTHDEVIGFAKETFYQDLITFNDLADNRPKVRWRTLSSDRWSLGGTGLDMTTFTLTRFNNAGAFVDIPMEVNQSDGQITFENRFKCNGRAIELRSADTATASTFQWKPGGILFMELASGTIASPLMSFVRYSNTGGFLGLPLQINRLTGGIVLPELPTSSAGLPSGGLFKSGGFVAIV